MSNRMCQSKHVTVVDLIFVWYHMVRENLQSCHSSFFWGRSAKKLEC